MAIKVRGVPGGVALKWGNLAHMPTLNPTPSWQGQRADPDPEEPQASLTLLEPQTPNTKTPQFFGRHSSGCVEDR